MKPYKDELDSLRFSDAQKQEMIGRLLDAKKEGQKVKPVKFRRYAAVGVAAAVCLTVTAFALPNSPVRRLVSDVFSGILGGDPALADELGTSIGQSASSGGVTITADAVVGDESNLCVVFTVARDDGQPIKAEGENSFLHFGSDSRGLLDSARTGGHGSSYFIDTDPSDAAIQYVESVTVEDGISALRGKTANVHFKDLMLFQDGAEEVLVKGDWKLSIPLQYTDATQHFESAEPIEVAGKTFAVTDIALSPVGFNFAMLSDDAIPYRPDEKMAEAAGETSGSGGGVAIADDGTETPLGAQYDSRDTYYEGVKAVLVLTDGTQLDLSESGGGMRNLKDDRLEITRSGSFDRLIPLEEMEALVFGGVRIPLQ